MQITVIGAGNGGTAAAADLQMKGHNVTLLKSSNKGNTEHFDYLEKTGGEITFIYENERKSVFLDKVTKSFEEALTPKTEIIILFIPTTYQQEVIAKMLPYLHDDQIILLEPGYLGTIYFLQHKNIPKIVIVEAESSPMDCRIIEPGVVQIYFENVKNPIGVFPKAKEEETAEKLSGLGYSFVLTTNVIEAALHNPNLIVHTIGGIMSIPRIDYTNGEYWMYKEVFSDHIWNLIQDLDNEKMDVLEKLGLPRISYLDACNFRNSKNPKKETALENFKNYAENNSVKGPDRSDSRYITEDVPQGLVLLESLGAYLGVETPICSSLIAIASACMKTDFRENGRSIEHLGETYLNIILEESKTNESN